MKAVSNPGKFEADVEDWKNSKENLSNHIQLFLDLSGFFKNKPTTTTTPQKTNKPQPPPPKKETKTKKNQNNQTETNNK